MPQYKNRMYRKEMLAERRRLTSVLRSLETGEPFPPGVEHPTDDQGQQLSEQQIRDRVAELDGLLDRVHKD